MKLHAKGSLLVTIGVLLFAVAGCQDEKAVPAAAATVDQAAPTVEHPATGTPTNALPAADMPKDHPAH